VDRSLTADEYIVFEAGTHTDAIKIRYSDFERVAKPRVAEFAEKLH
jgi:Ala-tRNA(Pro) deacylase